MNKFRPLLLIALAAALFSCEKEYSNENSGNTGNDLIVGIDCRINKIVYTDTSGTAAGGTGTGLGSIEAAINSLDVVTKITKFDSLSNTIEFINAPIYSNDSVFINADEYFVVDGNKRIIKMHGLADPTDPFSLQYDVFFAYNTAGYLTTKTYFLSSSPTIPFYRVDYTYGGGVNLTHMAAVNLPGGDLEMDADITYFTNLVPRRFMYIFPDERFYPEFSQYLNFGTKNFNAVKNMKVRNYNPGNVVRDSLVSTFSNYIMSRDGYVLSTQMAGDDQPSLPALAGKLSFSYHCK
ncbi:MAG: hypothetical protein ACKOU7_13865 [Ferruginibacter sp.]